MSRVLARSPWELLPYQKCLVMPGTMADINPYYGMSLEEIDEALDVAQLAALREEIANDF